MRSRRFVPPVHWLTLALVALAMANGALFMWRERRVHDHGYVRQTAVFTSVKPGDDLRILTQGCLSTVGYAHGVKAVILAFLGDCPADSETILSYGSVLCDAPVLLLVLAKRPFQADAMCPGVQVMGLSVSSCLRSRWRLPPDGSLFVVAIARDWRVVFVGEYLPTPWDVRQILIAELGRSALVRSRAGS